MGSDDRFQASIRDQAFMATEEADVVIFIVDGTSGLSADDAEIARILLRSDTPSLLVVNKVDNPADDEKLWEFYSLGMGEPWPISALHGTGTGDLLDEVVDLIKDLPPVSPDEEEPAIDIAIIGRPNAGKSTLMNALTGVERSIVSSVAGTTRDAIDTTIRHESALYRLVDTAGLRRKGQIDEDVEYYGFVRAMRAIDRADVALLVIDGTIGLTDQDQRVAGFAQERGCAMVILLNKWDAVDGPEAKADIRERIKDRLMFVGYAPVVAISALTGKNLHRIWTAVDSAYDHYSAQIKTNALNSWLADLREFGHSVSKGKKRLKLSFVRQSGVCPPAFTFFVNHPELVDDAYRRYLENRLRQSFELAGTPIRLRFKKKD